MKIRLSLDVDLNPAVHLLMVKALRDPVRAGWLRYGIGEALALWLRRVGAEGLDRSVIVTGGSVKVIEDEREALG